MALPQISAWPGCAAFSCTKHVFVRRARTSVLYAKNAKSVCERESKREREREREKERERESERVREIRQRSHGMPW